MEHSCQCCGALLGQGDLFCGECGAKVEAPLMAEAAAPATSAETTTARPKLLRDVLVYFVLALFSSGTAEYLANKLFELDGWYDAGSTVWLICWAVVAVCFFVVLRLGVMRLLDETGPALFGNKLLAEIACFVIAIAIMSPEAVADIVAKWFVPDATTVWYEFQIITAAFATALYTGYLVVARKP